MVSYSGWRRSAETRDGTVTNVKDSDETVTESMGRPYIFMNNNDVFFKSMKMWSQHHIQTLFNN